MKDLNASRQLGQLDESALPWVQVRVQTVTTCARLLDTYTTRDQVEFSKLHLHTPFTGIAHYPSDRVRPCSGFDGRCFCSGEFIQPEPVESIQMRAKRLNDGAAVARVCVSVPSAAAVAVPHGNHGDNNLSATPATGIQS